MHIVCLDLHWENTASHNFQSTEIIKLARGENDSQLSKLTQCEQDTYEMQVRAANIGKYTLITL